MLSLAVLICALLGANAEIPTWDVSCVGCPLRSLADHKVESAGGFLATTLTVDVITLKTPNTTFKTRVYNGALGGPRLVLQAGDKVELTLINNLEDRDNTGEWNQPRKPNTTNLHLHGMHVSGRAPGDDITIIVPPRGHYSYSYEIPEDHMPGHHWYHPHHHGGTALQNSGGMYGSIEVNDPEFVQPPEIEALPIRTTRPAPRRWPRRPPRRATAQPPESARSPRPSSRSSRCFRRRCVVPQSQAARPRGRFYAP